MQNTDAVLKLQPTNAFKPAISKLVDRVLELMERERDNTWFAQQKTLTVEYLRYDGRDADSGVDVLGRAAAAAEERRKAEAQGVVAVESDEESGDEESDGE